MKKILSLLSFGLALVWGCATAPVASSARDLRVAVYVGPGAGVTVVANGAEALDALRRLDRAKR